MYGAILATAGGLAKGIMGAVQASKAKKALRQYDRQELTNVHEVRRISTSSEEYAQEQLLTTGATAMDAIKASGVRGVVGAVPKITQNLTDTSAKIGASIDQKLVELEDKKAQDDIRIRDMQERREEADLAGIGQQLAVGQQNMFSGISDVAGGVSSFMAQGQANKDAGKSFWGN